MDAWLRDGGVVVAASERAARALRKAFHRRRRSDGLKAWVAPNIVDWGSFVRSAWEEQSRDARLLLNGVQEQSLWASLLAEDGRLATLLEGPRYRLADLAMEAHELLCEYAPRYLRASTRSGWQNDAGAFGRWLAEFDQKCGHDQLLSASRLPLELLRLLETDSAGKASRPALVLAGFDRILPVQRGVFEAWGAWKLAAPSDRAPRISFHEVADDASELAACALWARQRLEADPQARLLVVTQDAAQRRGQLERALLHAVGPSGFEFSLGIPLSQVTLPRTGLLLLRWLTRAIAEHELDWLFSTGHAGADAAESAALQQTMRGLRRRGMQRPAWTLEALVSASGLGRMDSLPATWVERMGVAKGRLEEFGRRTRGPVEWAEFVPQLLQSMAWPGGNSLASAEFQAARRWQQVLETGAGLGFDGRRINFRDFVSSLQRVMEEMLFAPESEDAPVLIAGPAESAGLEADAIWFLGASEDAWPPRGSANPLLPIEVLREARMPHGSAQLDWEVAEAVTARLAASAEEVNFSYARQVDGVEARPSRLVARLAGAAVRLESAQVPSTQQAVRTIVFEDFDAVPFARGDVPGGSAVMTAQSLCPFKAFAEARLGAQGWEAAQAGLTPAQRGQLLHAVMHRVWSGKPVGIRTFEELQAIADRPEWVRAHVARVFGEQAPSGVGDRMPSHYLELEQDRLTRLVSAWLDFEATRVPFEVVETEAKRTVAVGGLALSLRLDRLDRLNDGSVLVVDYKTGDVKPKLWELDRPEDVQLPLYAGFGLEDDQMLGGLAFAKLRPGDVEFAGCVGAPASTLFAGLKSYTALMKNCLTAEQVMDWRDYIEKLAREFLAGRAIVDPRDPPDTCERCGLQTLCRIQDGLVAVNMSADDDESESVDE